MTIRSIVSNKWVLGLSFFIVYTILVNWKFSLILMATIAFHEYGHLWAAKRKGLSTGGFIFIPLIGGLATVKENYKTYAQQAYVAIMGPVWGLVLAFLTMSVGIMLRNTFLTTTASWMALFNLFNLIPISLFDGGQLLKTVTLTISKKYGFTIINVVTLIVGIVFFRFISSPIIVIAIFLSIAQNSKEKDLWQYKNLILPKDLNKKQMTCTIVGYLATAALLVFVFLFSMNYTHSFTGHYTYWVK